jgi:hypothetical protein
MFISILKNIGGSLLTVIHRQGIVEGALEHSYILTFLILREFPSSLKSYQTILRVSGIVEMCRILSCTYS